MRTGRARRARPVLLERHRVVGPRREHRLDDPPQLLGLVAADGQGRVAFQDLLQQEAVGRQVLGGELGVEADLLEVEGVALGVEVCLLYTSPSPRDS